MFPDLTVAENISLGSVLRSDRRAVAADVERAYEYFPRLRERIKQRAGTLSRRRAQMLGDCPRSRREAAPAALDEPSLGLAPIIVEEIFSMLRTIQAAEGIAVLLVEQNVGVALDVARDAISLANGVTTLHGSADELRASERVRSSYLT